MGLKINLSFKQEEVDLYNYLKSKRNASVYMKDLIEADMKKDNKPSEKREVNNNTVETLDF